MSPDLADHHEFVSELFSLPRSRDDWEQFRLRDDQVAFYHEHGYLTGIRIFTDAQVEVLRSELANMVRTDHPRQELWHEFHSNESPDPSQVLFHALGAWRIEPGFHDTLWNPAFTLPASQLLGGAVRFWHDQLFCKPARHGGVVAWHQDYSYWTRTEPMQHLTTWTGLDDADQDNGCLLYVPGSHRWDLLPITGLAGDMEAIRKVLTDSQWNALQNPVPAILKKGEAAFHHPLMIHGSNENRSDRPRRALVLNTFKDGTRSNTDQVLLAGIPPSTKGQPLQGKFFPLLLDPRQIETTSA